MFLRFQNRIYNMNECVLIKHEPAESAISLLFRAPVTADRNGRPHGNVHLTYSSPEMAAFAYGRVYIGLQFGWSHVNVSEESLRRVLNRIQEARRTERG